MTDAGEMSIGMKRQAMILGATAEWVSFVDDDDIVPLDYCKRQASVMFGANPPDVVGFRLGYFVDGVRSGEAIHSYRAAEIPTPNLGNGIRFNRLPNHLNPTRRELAVKAGYRDMRTGEDGDYARRLADLKPRETFLDAEMYQYLYRTERVEWRGGVR